ncbi:MAG: hypothetical protein KC619_15875 [Myxococcales bacterium]|nr:hypothetical protein [Myxococcales bacterium]
MSHARPAPLTKALHKTLGFGLLTVASRLLLVFWLGTPTGFFATETRFVSHLFLVEALTIGMLLVGTSIAARQRSAAALKVHELVALLGVAHMGLWVCAWLYLGVQLGSAFLVVALLATGWSVGRGAMLFTVLGTSRSPETLAWLDGEGEPLRF